MNKITSIYILIDPFTQAIRYVGVTNQGLDERLAEHIYYARKGDKCHRSCWIRKLLSDNLKPIIQLVEETNDRLANDIGLNTMLRKVAILQTAQMEAKEVPAFRGNQLPKNIAPSCLRPM